jgi:hypothetical protein
MTINVAVKCPDGIVIGADGLVTIPGLEPGTMASMVPYFTKLFEIKKYAAGAMINGTGSIGGRTVEDIISEFNENVPESDSSNYSLEEVSRRLGTMINHVIMEYKKPVSLELIVGGYSKGKKSTGRRYGEIYSLRWKKVVTPGTFPSKYTFHLRPVYNKDRQFGTHYGGQPKIPDRFKYGIDDYHLQEMWKRRIPLFKSAEKFILNDLKRRGVKISRNYSSKPPDRLQDFDIYSLFSEYEPGGTGSEIIRKVKENMIWKLNTMEGYFSLQTAVNYCSFIMWCAYAENAFTLVLPTVGSEMRIATITREKGFDLIRQWNIQSPGPPFR